MGTRSPDELKHALESERERLGTAVTRLRSQAATARRRLPLVALGAAGTGFVLRTAAKRVFRRDAAGKKRRARSSFRGRD
jgi:hypothetical protein